MSNRKFGGKLRRQVIVALKTKVNVLYTHQEQPNTFVKVEWYVALPQFEQAFRGAGYSKANWPDEWNAEFGMDLAFEKAVGKIADQISRRDDAFVFVEALGIDIEGQLESYHKIAESLVSVGS